MKARLVQVRAHSEALVQGLTAEECQVQSMPDASPLKWHLAHTSWFFDTFVLQDLLGEAPVHEAYGVMFNSYYVGVGERALRAERGLMTWPALDQVMAYRQHVTARLLAWLEARGPETTHPARLTALIELGLNHEQQHQELMVTDFKHLLSRNRWKPTGSGLPIDDRPPGWAHAGAEPGAQFVPVPGGLVTVGHDPATPGFAFDNEGPAHRVWLEPFEVATQPVSNGQWLAFMADGGYARPELWLSEGWDWVQREGWQAPLYWRCQEGQWRHVTLQGERPVEPHATAMHLSYFEAEAFARWASARLPTEAEWEHAARLASHGGLHGHAPLQGLESVVWQWTASAYLPYPGFAPAVGAVGEYNGKFMVNQMVLRGGSLATPVGHTRGTYRNFFPAQTRWQFSGVRLAR